MHFCLFVLQFDTSATAVIMTKIQTKDKYMKLMNGMEIIESRYYSSEIMYFAERLYSSTRGNSILLFPSLHSHLVEHLNAEIVLQTISDVNMALDWIRSSLLYIRALKNPTHYGQNSKHKHKMIGIRISVQLLFHYCM